MLQTPVFHSGGEDLNPILPHVVEIGLSLVVFGILFFALRKFVVPKFEEVFAERTNAIEGGLKAAETKQAEADKRLASWRSSSARPGTRPRASARKHASRAPRSSRSCGSRA